jgi:hypothetical protein
LETSSVRLVGVDHPQKSGTRALLLARTPDNPMTGADEAFCSFARQENNLSALYQ